MSAAKGAAGRRVSVAIATPLEPDLATRVAAVDDRIELRYQPDLLPPLRFAGDHRGVADFTRDPGQQQRWNHLVGGAEVLFGLPGDSPEGLAEAVRANPGLRWVQATAGGAGEQVAAAGLTAAEQERVQITRAGGVHAGPLAEFALFGILAFTKGLPRLIEDRRVRRWPHYPVPEVRDRTVLLVGVGPIGAEVARLASAFGMPVMAVNRSGHSDAPHVAETHAADRLADLVPRAGAIVISLPLTEQTRGMIDARLIGKMRPDAVVVNVGRGGVVDEAALTAALASGALAGAALDVFATEPLPADSPLWTLPNVLLSPHTAGLSLRENERIVELFTENLARYLRGEQLLHRLLPGPGSARRSNRHPLGGPTQTRPEPNDPAR